VTVPLGLDEYFAIAAEQLGVDSATVLLVSRVDLAESAINAPHAEFGGVEFYPQMATKVAVLISRLARNHPLPDANKRSALVAGVMFARANGYDWSPPPEDKDDGDATVAVMLAVAEGSITQDELAVWVAQRLVSP